MQKWGKFSKLSKMGFRASTFYPLKELKRLNLYSQSYCFHSMASPNLDQSSLPPNFPVTVIVYWLELNLPDFAKFDQINLVLKTGIALGKESAFFYILAVTIRVQVQVQKLDPVKFEWFRCIDPSVSLQGNRG